jgi:hypothetical protein
MATISPRITPPRAIIAAIVVESNPLPFAEVLSGTVVVAIGVEEIFDVARALVNRDE